MLTGNISVDRSECPSRERLLGFARGLLSKGDSREVGSHLQGCSRCESIIEQDLKLRETESLLDSPAADESGSTSLSADVEGISEMSPRRYPIRKGSVFNRQLRDYRLLEKLGEGGMGAVYKAEHTKLKRLVAVKLLAHDRRGRTAAVARFEREMAAVGTLDHPNIVRALDAGEQDGTQYLVMEYVQGVDLSRLSQQSRRLPIAEACELIRQVAMGLQHIHEHGLVHRDIKPSNVMVTEKGDVKILDLGLALLHTREEMAGELTGAGEALGTVDYMAPERHCGSSSKSIPA